MKTIHLTRSWRVICRSGRQPLTFGLSRKESCLLDKMWPYSHQLCDNAKLSTSKNGSLHLTPPEAAVSYGDLWLLPLLCVNNVSAVCARCNEEQHLRHLDHRGGIHLKHLEQLTAPMLHCIFELEKQWQTDNMVSIHKERAVWFYCITWCS